MGEVEWKKKEVENVVRQKILRQVGENVGQDIEKCIMD